MNWLLLRGLGREKRHWFDFPDCIKKQNEKVLCLDLPGFGEASAAKVPLTIHAHTEFLRHRFQSMNHGSEPWCLIGISLGGMVAMDWAYHYPEGFSNLVLINSSSRDLSPTIQRLSVYALYCISRSLSAKNLKSSQRQLLKMTSNLKTKDAHILSTMVEIAKTSEQKNKKVLRQLYAASRFDSPPEIQIPTLVLAAIKDRMVDVRCSKALAEKLKATIKFHPTAGHELALDDPNWVAEQVHEFTGSTKN